MEIGVAGPIFTHKNISKALRDNDINTAHNERQILCQLLHNKGSMGQKFPYSITRVKNIVTNLHIYGPRAVLLLFCNNQNTKSE